MVGLADEDEFVVSNWRKIFYHYLNHWYAVHLDERFGVIVASYRKSAASTSHGNNDLKHIEPFVLLKYSFRKQQKYN